MSKIELKHVDKYYGKNHILKDVNLTIEDGDFMTLLGPSGCGKTTTLRVVSGLEKPQNGTIHMDGKEIVNAAEAHFAPPSERDLNLVFQSYALWPHMTVRENIALARPDATEAEIEAAAKAAHAHGFITRLPQGYDTPLSGNGASLSQGQRQLLAIARAAVADPPVMILDEATSSIDTRTEAIVQRGMDALMTGRTVFVIAHRLSTVKNADAIMVLDHGRIIERGTHDELIHQEGLYKRINAIQNSLEDELEAIS